MGANVKYAKVSHIAKRIHVAIKDKATQLYAQLRTGLWPN